MNEILPKLKKETIFDKFKKWFNSIFNPKAVEENFIKGSMNEKNNIVIPKNKRSNFIENIQVENKDRIFVLQ